MIRSALEPGELVEAGETVSHVEGTDRPVSLQVLSVSGRLALMLALGFGIGMTVTAGFDPVSGPPRVTIVLVAGVLIASAMGALALTRFAGLVMVLLTIRSSLDVTKGVLSPLDLTVLIGAAFVLASMLWLYLDVRTSARRRPSTAVMGMLLLIAAGGLSVLGSTAPGISGLELARLVTAGSVLIVAERVLRTAESRRSVMIAIMVSIVPPGLVAATQLLGGDGWVVDGLSRISGTFLHPNSFGMYMSFVVVLATAMTLHATTRTGRLLLAGTVVMGLGLLVTTYMRGAWIATVVGLLFVVLLERPKLLPGLGVLLVGVVLVTPSIQTRFADLAQTQTASGTPANSLVWRIGQWQEVASLARDRPVTGLGLRMVQESTTDELAAHSDVVRVVAEMGVAGLLAYLTLIVGLVGVSRRALMHAEVPSDRALAVGAAACLVAWLTMSLAANVVSQSVVMWYFLSIMGAASAISFGTDRPEVDPEGIDQVV